jgi:uncharacterized protein (TIGR00369 family)
LAKEVGNVSSQERTPLRDLVDDDWCFVCGKENPNGLGIVWSLEEDGSARGRFRPERRHQGWRGVLHGGILAALLDEAMAQCAGLTGRPAVTASLAIRFRSPAPIDSNLIAEARIVAARGRLLQLEAAVRDGRTETCYASAEGTCMRLPQPTG